MQNPPVRVAGHVDEETNSAGVGWGRDTVSPLRGKEADMAVIRRTTRLIYETERQHCANHKSVEAVVFGRTKQRPKDPDFVYLCADCATAHGYGIGQGLGQDIIYVDLPAAPPTTPKKRASKAATPRLRGAAKKAATAKKAPEPASQPESGDTVSQEPVSA